MNSLGMKRSLRSATGAYLERELDATTGASEADEEKRRRLREELERREAGGARKVSANATAKRRARRSVA